MKKEIEKVLLLGSGALKIGEAGEFDYSGSQAIKALKEEDIEVILVNPNIATVQTDSNFADEVYFLPVTSEFVKGVIEKERPDGILLSFGGQTALNCGVELKKEGVLSEYGVEVLGTSLKTIQDSEDRAKFRERLENIGIKTPSSKPVESTGEGMQFAEEIGFPVMVRAAYELGGKGSGIVDDEEELESKLDKVFSHAEQALVEESLEGWKEVEYEVVRDRQDNCITVCNMENMDPLGIHTGESIVVAPSQTLTNSEYHKLREVAIEVIRDLGVVGECNIQYALDPVSEDYRVIEVNSRLSRSSALASKATGYPLAFVASKLALGYTLPELENKVTKKTKAFFEPALDYVVVKLPRWDLQKFESVDDKIGSEMKSVGEVMAIGRKFEEALQKAIRMLQIGKHGFADASNKNEFSDLELALEEPTDKRIFAISAALENGYTLEEIHERTGVDKWFLVKCKNIIDIGDDLKEEATVERLETAKKLGYSDFQIGDLIGRTELDVREWRKKLGIRPVVKQIDTLAAEWPAQTNYLYMTYNGSEHDIDYSKDGEEVIVLGSGAYRIGSSVEFDWCCVNAVETASDLDYRSIMINYNPETVSTDYDVAHKLYFDELSLERVLDIYELEDPSGLIVSMGGQIPNTLADKLRDLDVNILGTRPEDIDSAEDRSKFSDLLDNLGIDQPEWNELTEKGEAIEFAEKIGYPVMIRPSYVLSGSAMALAFDREGLEDYLDQASRVTSDYPVVISKFLQGAKEIEIDAVAQEGELIAGVVSEHVENAGVHSGDSSVVTPPQKVYIETLKRVRKAANDIAGALKITGPFNIQFLAMDNEIKVIECNLRSSRSFPFSSKVHGVNLASLATEAILGEEELDTVHDTSMKVGHVGVKAPQFSFSRLRGSDPIPSVEMSATGEVGCMGYTVEEAFLKSLMSVGMELPEENILITASGDRRRYEILEAVRELEEMGYSLFGTEHTAEFYREKGIEIEMLYKIQQSEEPNIETYLKDDRLDLVISIPSMADYSDRSGGPSSYGAKLIRRAAVDYSVPLLNNPQTTKLFVKSIRKENLDSLKVEGWSSYR